MLTEERLCKIKRRRRGLPKQRLLIVFEGDPLTLPKTKNDANRRLIGELAAQQGCFRCVAKDLKFPQNTHGADTRAYIYGGIVRRLNSLGNY